MHLSELIADLPLTSNVPSDVEITGLTADSRLVRPGWLFAAFPGQKQDGRAFIETAIAQGAAAILAPEDTAVISTLPFLTARHPRRLFARMAAAFYAPQTPINIAVTGTNGKSSTVEFCRQLWTHMGYAAASLGTLGVTSPTFRKPGALTTPDPVTFFAEVKDLAVSGVTHLALEASSQGLDQHRLDGLSLTAAGFTNLTRDHLDYHGSMEQYLSAKKKLFSEVLQPQGIAVVNADDPAAAEIEKLCATRNIPCWTVGKKGRDIHLEHHRPLTTGQFLTLNIHGARYDLELPLVGAFQADNAILALGLVLATAPEKKPEHIIAGLAALKPVRGRLEIAGRHANGAAVYVDYAHTPDGLQTMLLTLRPHVQEKLHIVFGCGGDRDRGKRPLMGKIAQDLADHVIVTDDNPRSENSIDIRQAILTTTPKAQNIGDRKAAIRTAIQSLQSGDVLVIAGKGHEQGQIVGTQVLPFDDIEEAKKALSETL